jgi:phosphoribosylamine-glycine ligase
MKLKIVVLGSGAREHALLTALYHSQQKFHSDQSIQLHCIGTNRNPAISALCAESSGILTTGDITDSDFVLQRCQALQADLVIIGPEAPLESGVADLLRHNHIDVLGPGKALARIETSKSFARTFLSDTIPQACPAFSIVGTTSEAAAFLATLGQHYVIKADGLTGGKGVKVAQDHLRNHLRPFSCGSGP